jgi:two-component system cell cycle response regulator
MAFSPFRIQIFVGEGCNNLPLISLFEKEGFKVQKCELQSQENDWKYEFSPDLIILIPGKSQISGSDIKSISQSMDGSSDFPFIVVSEKPDFKEASQYFNLGALDYLTLPKDDEYLLTFFRTRLSTVRRFQEKDRLINRLLEANNQLEVLAATDVLTGLINRRKMFDICEQEIIRFHRNKNPFCVMMSDIDHFKIINDQYGHAAGDYILVEYSKIHKKNSRRLDRIARWGGEEFLTLLPETDLEGGGILAEKLRQKIESHPYFYNDAKIKVTASFGIAEFDELSEIDQCIQVADSRLYQAKNSGRNKVVIEDDKSILKK